MTREIKFRAWDRESKSMRLKAESQLNWLILHKDFEVMQFTGLKDKNGKEIYEGDILKTSEGNQEVVFGNGGFCLKHKFKALSFIVDGERCEIIGNIYENEDLIKKLSTPSN